MRDAGDLEALDIAGLLNDARQTAERGATSWTSVLPRGIANQGLTCFRNTIFQVRRPLSHWYSFCHERDP